MKSLKYLIAIPCHNTIPTPFVASLTYMNRVGMSRVTFVQNSMVYDARHMLIAEALDEGVDRVLFLDSDMTFDSHLMERFAADMDAGHDYVCGLCFRRVFPTNPVLFKSVDPEDKSKSVLYLDYPKDGMFEIAASGFGAVMLSTRLIKDVVDKFEYPFAPKPGVYGEDVGFCLRARQAGYRLWCDPRIKVGHVGTFVFDEKMYLAQEETRT